MIKDLSVEAQCIYGGHYQHMKCMELSFNRAWVISEQMLRGLNDLVEAGYLTREDDNYKGRQSSVFKPTEKMLDCKETISREFMEQHGRFKIIDESLKKDG